MATKPASTLKTAARRRESMSSTLKCFEVMEVLAQEPYELPLSEIAARLSQPLTTTHRLATTLVEAGFAEQDPASRRYRLAGKALWAGAAYLRNSPVYRAAFLVMQESARECPGLIHLGALHAKWVLYLHTVGSPSRLYLYADTGERRPLHATGLGKAILAWQSPESLSRLTGQRLVSFGRNCGLSDSVATQSTMKKEFSACAVWRLRFLTDPE
jgi:IclR family transcriptional regulator, KDG regulon repressor